MKNIRRMRIDAPTPDKLYITASLSSRLVLLVLAITFFFFLRGTKHSKENLVAYIRPINKKSFVISSSRELTMMYCPIIVPTGGCQFQT